MMGRIDSRVRQGKAIGSSTTESLGNVSCVRIGDPAQCDAMGDEQFYHEKPQKDNSMNEDCKHRRLSNIGLSVYAEFDEVVILTHNHRVCHHRRISAIHRTSLFLRQDQSQVGTNQTCDAQRNKRQRRVPPTVPAHSRFCFNSLEGTRYDTGQRKASDGQSRFLARCTLYGSDPPSGHDHVHRSVS